MHTGTLLSEPATTRKLRGVREECQREELHLVSSYNPFSVEQGRTLWVYRRKDKHGLQRLHGPKPVSWLRRGTCLYFLTHCPPLMPPRPTQLDFSRAGRTRRRPSSEHLSRLCSFPLTFLPATQMPRVGIGNLSCALGGLHFLRGCNPLGPL